MAKEKGKTGTESEEAAVEVGAEEEEQDDESADDEVEEEESEDENAEDESDDDESEDEDKSKKGSKKTNDLDVDAELEKERKAGEPDLTVAEKAFKERTEKRGAGKSKDDADKPLSQADLDAFEARIRKESQQERALELAKEMAGPGKEAELIVAKWSNRTFPKNLPLRDQITEMYGAVFANKLIGERNEALRGLKGKQAVVTNNASGHRDAPKGNAPKLSPADEQSLKNLGFKFNNVSRQYEKKLQNGRILVRDPKTKQVKLLPKR